MINLRFKFVRVADEPFNKQALLDDIAVRLKRLFKDGTIIDDGLGQGFNVRFGKPTTLQDFLFPTTEFIPVANSENLTKIRNLMG
jgi:hypothetical protein